MLNKNKTILIGVLMIVLLIGIVYGVGNKKQSFPKEVFLNYRAQVKDIVDFNQLESINEKYFSEQLMSKTEQQINQPELSKDKEDEIIKIVKSTLFVSGKIVSIEQELKDKKTGKLFISFDSGKTYELPFVFEEKSWKFGTLLEVFNSKN